MGCVRENELLRISDFVFCDLLIMTKDYFPNLQPGVDPNCDFLFWGGGRRADSKFEFRVCVRENKLLRISDFLFCDLLILAIDYIFQIYNQAWIQIVTFYCGGGEVIQSVIFGGCVKDNKLLRISK